MDPQANLNEQREIARSILARPNTITSQDSNDPGARYSLLDSALRLAELVLALDEWRQRGGFDPYTTS